MLPKVSAIMPTMGRTELAIKAVNCWLSQDYQNKELVILDDNERPSLSVQLIYDGVRHLHEEDRENIPQKLNRLCRMAQGEIIVRFDDDDWSAPGRITEQVNRLIESGKGVTGYHSMLFLGENGECRKYRGSKDYMLGTPLCFRKSFWESHPFNESMRTSSDNQFWRDARAAGEVTSVDAGEMMFARSHSANTQAKRMWQYDKVSAGECRFALEVDGILQGVH